MADDAKIRQLLETLVEAVHKEPTEDSEPKSPLKRNRLDETSEYEKAETPAHVFAGWTSRLLLKIPVVNLAYDILGDRMPPSAAELTDVLNLMGLLSALMLTITMALPGALSFDEVQDPGGQSALQQR